MDSQIAIVGMACRFPGAASIEEFRQLLAEGGSAVGPAPEARFGDLNKLQRAARWGGFLEDVDHFDADFFRIAAVEARLLDPQQRMLLETSWHALEDASIAPGSLRGTKAAVHVGIFTRDYDQLIASTDAGELYAVAGSSASMAAGRISHFFGLEGPAVAVDTSMSSSLVALHQAAAVLQKGEVDLALVGGVNALLSPRQSEIFARAGMLAADGRCKAFDAAADGYVRGEGCGVVVLKRLDSALADGDRVWCVIRGSAVNHDGASADLLAPSVTAQRRLLRRALAQARVSPAEVDYLEGHGTGTSLGDVTELRAAADVYQNHREAGPLLIGSVKPNIGHLEAAAGIAGVIKTALAMRAGVIPGHPHLNAPNQEIDWQSSGIRVVGSPTEWPDRDQGRRIAAVSSFGLSGTNAHVILESHRAPSGEASDSARRLRFLPVAGQSDEAVFELARRYGTWLQDVPPRAQSRLADMAWTATKGRTHGPRRSAVTFESKSDLAAGLDLVASRKRRPGNLAGSRVAFLFTGQGSQWVGMGRTLYEEEPVARDTLDGCEAIVRRMRGASLLEVMFGESTDEHDLADTAWTQPALYAFGAALADLWAAAGVRPMVVLGHSVAEITAMYAAGAYSLAEGMELATLRGSVMGNLPDGGAMAAVFAPRDDVARAVARFRADGALSVAGHNGTHTVVSGAEGAVAKLAVAFADKGMRVEALKTSVAGHSPLMDAALEKIGELLDRTWSKQPEVPIVSNVTGQLHDAATVVNGSYWREHARRPVEFARGVETIADLGPDVLLELGPRGFLGSMALGCWPGAATGQVPTVIASCAGPGREDFAICAAAAWEAGLDLKAEALFAGEGRRRISLPPYPFQRKRFWFDAKPLAAKPAELRAVSAPQDGGAGIAQAPIAEEASPRWDLESDPSRLAALLRQEVRQVLQSAEPPPRSAGFFSLGMDSLLTAQLQTRINRALAGAMEVSSSTFFNYPDISALAGHIAERLHPESTPSRQEETPAPVRSRTDGGIAIVGVACRFPDGDGLDQFWDLLAQGRCAVTQPPPDRQYGSGASPACYWGAFIDHIDRFDAEFFRIAPLEARLLDPQQRMLLETSWQAVEDAGIDPTSLAGSRTGVYAGVFTSDYKDLVLGEGGRASLYMASGTTASAAIGRIAYTLGLEGPAIATDTACSSSLVAMHQAASALRDGEVDIALTGGVNALLSLRQTEMFAEARMLAPDGLCKTFDERADGYVRGEGCAMVVLKRLADAEADGDRIWGVIRGSAVNQDGASSGLTVPNGLAQQRVIRRALEVAGVDPKAVEYLEAHGTGTPLGDPVEVEAAAAVYGQGRRFAAPLRMGSVKTNFGHLEAAAGIAGVVKVLLAMKHGVIPPHLHVNAPNPRIDWAALPVKVTREAERWEALDGKPRLAAVSSFGFSGTNAHVVLQSHEPFAAASSGASVPARESRRTVRMLPLSGKTEQAVRDLAARYLEWVDGRASDGAASRDAPLLADAAWTAGVGRAHFDQRAAPVFANSGELRDALAALASGEGRVVHGRCSKPALLFTGQGSQWSGMGKRLYETEPVVRATLDRCDAAMRELADVSLLDVMFGRPGARGGLDDTAWTQPCLYALECAVAKLWSSMGLSVAAVIGHSVGEIAAAHVAGVYSLEDGLAFAVQRGKLTGGLPRDGKMAAVFASKAAIEEALETVPGVSIAADNGTHYVVSGREPQVASVVERFRHAGARVQELNTGMAGHSELMDPVLEDMERLLDDVSLSAPSLPFVSTLTGNVLSTPPDGAYWRRHVREPVAFASAVRTLADMDVDAVVEVGPEAVLGPMALSIWPDHADCISIPTLQRDAPGDFAPAAAGAYQAGLALDFRGLFAGEKRKLVSVPSYPFQRERHWVSRGAATRGPGGHPLLGARRDLPDGDISFETVLHADDPLWLADHRVFDRVVAPAALFASQLLDAAGCAQPGRVCSIDDFQLHNPLILTRETGKKVQVLLKREGDFEVVSREVDADAPWELHASGRTRSRSDAPVQRDPVSPAGAVEPLDVGDFYRTMAANEIAYGANFRTIAALRANGDCAVGEVTLPGQVHAEDLSAHPVVLDGLFQVAYAALGASDRAKSWLPFGWDRLWVAGTLPREVVCHVQFTSRQDADNEKSEGAATLRANLEVRSRAGEVLAAVEGFTLKRAEASAFAGSDVGQLLHEVVWRPAPAEATRVRDSLGPQTAEPGRFVLCGDGAAANGLAAALQAAGKTVAAQPTRTTDRRQWRRLFESLPDDVPFDGIVHLVAAGEDETRVTTPRMANAVEHSQRSALAMLQGLADAGVSPTLGVWFVTRGGQVVRRERTAALSGAALWGFAATAALEMSDLNVRLLDLDPEAPIDAAALARELLTGDPNPRIAWRGAERLAARLAPLTEHLGVPTDHPWRVEPSPDGTLRSMSAQKVPRTGLAPGEIRVRIEAAGVNFLDVMLGMGLVDAAPTFGAEMCGVVVETAAAEDRFAPGDRVVGFGWGAFATEVVTRADLVAKAPPELTSAELATVPIAFVTAELSFAFGQLQSGDRVLVHAATGGVGQAAIQLARAAGLEVFATASRPKHGTLRSLGVTHAFDSRSCDFGSEILAATDGEGVDLVINSLTGEGFIEASLSCLAVDGRFVELAKRGIWSDDEMRAARPDVGYQVVAVDRLVSEQPREAGRVLRRVLERLDGGELRPLPHSRWPLTEAADALDYMRQARHVGKIVLTPPPVAAGALRPDRTYVVTGGLGGIGLEVAGWLVEHGAGAVVLASRRPPTQDEEETLSQWTHADAEVAVEVVDVADEAAVQRLVAQMGAKYPTLGGVVHSAGVLSDGAIENQSWAGFETVLAPKVVGAWNLHRATRHLDLDFFMLFSSVVGVLGNPGQANHAAASAFLDQLARHRRNAGLAGQAIAWGPWLNVGQAERDRERIAGALARTGHRWITPTQGLAALSHLATRDVPTATVGQFDWLASAFRSPFVEEVASPEPSSEREPTATDLPTDDADALTRLLQREVADVLRLRTTPAADAGFFTLGMDSLMAIELRNRLNRTLGPDRAVSNTAVFDYPNAESLAAHLLAKTEAEAPPAATDAQTAKSPHKQPIAIVGMSCRFPGANGLSDFWTRLESGYDAITFGRAGHFGAYLDDIDRFDAEFFRIAPVEANLMDPQQRLLLEVSWQALEDAGIEPGSLRGAKAGVYAGVSTQDYRELVASSADAAHRYMSTGTFVSAAIGRIAFTLGMEGPAVAVDTACSSSLVAVHQAAVALERGEADLALAGGANALLSANQMEAFTEAGMLAPDGRCKTFDASADGYVRGEGCGMVVLKRLDDAQRDGDRIWGLVLGSAINQDGASSGLTVPSGPSQQRVIGQALRAAGLEPSQVDYLEAHGTGTQLGDPIEVNAAAAAYGRDRGSDRPLLIGSVKTNIGHLEAAAGVAGMIKTILAMSKGVIPRHLNFEEPNPRIAWDQLPVTVASDAAPWPAERDRPRRAGVSSFGFSGTNAHVVLESAPAVPAADSGADAATRPASPESSVRPARAVRLLPLSGRSPEAVRNNAIDYLAWLSNDRLTDVEQADRLADMAWTASTGRSQFDWRAGVAFEGMADLERRLERVADGRHGATNRRVESPAFLFTGQGSQWVGMGQALYRTEPVFRKILDRCDELVRSARDKSLLNVMFEPRSADGDLGDTRWTQPALYALQCGLAALWESIGVTPSAVLGHSVGEIAAARAAGVVSLEDGLRLAIVRGDLMGDLPTNGPQAGAMIAAFAPAEEVAEVAARLDETGDALSMAALNGTHCVFSGRKDAVRQLAAQLAEREVRATPLETSHAFHSPLIDPILDDLERQLQQMPFATPEPTFVSNVSGQPTRAIDAAYWRRHATKPVNFAAGVASLADLGVDLLVEIGPHAVLGPLAEACWPRSEESPETPAYVATQLRDTSESLADGGFTSAVAAVWELGL